MYIFAMVLLVLSAVPLCGQSTLGVVLGSVKDATGAVIADATVKLTNVGENTSLEAVTDSNGDYAFRNTKAGRYTISVSRTGFRSFTVTDIVLVARETSRVDAQRGHAAQSLARNAASN